MVINKTAFLALHKDLAGFFWKLVNKHILQNDFIFGRFFETQAFLLDPFYVFKNK